MYAFITNLPLSTACKHTAHAVRPCVRDCPGSDSGLFASLAMRRQPDLLESHFPQMIDAHSSVSDERCGEGGAMVRAIRYFNSGDRKEATMCAYGKSANVSDSADRIFQ
jgi:hypothetical protein